MTESKSNRRDFLKTTGMSVAAATLASPLMAQEPVTRSDGKKFGYAIVGIGGLTRNSLLPAFATMKHARLTGLVSGDIEKARETAEKYGVPESGLYTYDTYDKIADNPDIDAVYIVLPNSMHHEYTLRGFKAGKHVLVEKPMAVTAKECEEMIAAGEEAKKLLSVAYRLRYEPYTQEMIRLARSQDFGKPQFILTEAGFNFGNPEQWRLKKELSGGGSMMDIGIYALNGARYLAGEEPTEVIAFESTDHSDPRFKDPGVENNVTWQMKFPSGTLASCVSSYGAYVNCFRVQSEHGSLELKPAWSHSGLKLNVTSRGKTEAKTFEEVNHFGALMDDLAICAATGKTPITDGLDGLNDLRVIEAVYESMKTGKPVKVVS